MKNIKGIKKAVGDYQRLNAGGAYSPHYGVMMLNKETGEIWTDEFYSLGHNSWKEYKDKNIMNLSAYMEQREITVNMNNVRIIASRIMEKFKMTYQS